jgi:hypothetical protein
MYSSAPGMAASTWLRRMSGVREATGGLERPSGYRASLAAVRKSGTVNTSTADSTSEALMNLQGGLSLRQPAAGGVP